MRLRTHVLSSLLAGVALYPRAPRRVALLVAGGVGLDIDHYLIYALRSGNWNPLSAWRYDGWRHRARAASDTRRRYGPLRSAFHHAGVTLPIVWGLQLVWPVLRPLALGVTLHLALDLPFLRLDWRVWRRAAGHCERCGTTKRRLDVVYLVPPRHGGASWALENRALWCRRCRLQVFG